MARVTVEDCIDKIPNRYELLMVAAQRAKDISAGSALTVNRDNDKNSVVALREIAEGTVNIEELQDKFANDVDFVVDVQDLETYKNYGHPPQNYARFPEPDDEEWDEDEYYAAQDSDFFEELM